MPSVLLYSHIQITFSCREACQHPVYTVAYGHEGKRGYGLRICRTDNSRKRLSHILVWKLSAIASYGFRFAEFH